MNKKEFEKLLKRYHEGTCTEAEKTILEAWFESLNLNSGQNLSDPESEDMGIDIKSQIDERINYKRVRIFNLRFLSAAASVLIMCCLSWFIVKNRNNNRNMIAQIAFKEIDVPKGGMKKILLSDGSTITLNGSSRLRFPETFSGSKREVSLLEGEGFFDIKHDSHKMFVVEALGTHTYVLGTAFNIHADKLTHEIQITVIRGKVSVTGLKRSDKMDTKPVILLPDEQITINKHNIDGDPFPKHLNAEDFTAWVQGKYKFSNESLGNVALILEKSFNVHIRFGSNSIKKIHFSSEFEITDKLDDLLFSICRANNLSYTINGQDILLTENHNQ